MSLFDSMIVPIILYGSEVWGIYNFKAVEKLHLRFCRKILGVSQQTPNYAVYGELGRFPLYILAKERSIGFYLKLLKKPDSLLFKSFHDQILSNVKHGWAYKMKKKLLIS